MHKCPRCKSKLLVTAMHHADGVTVTYLFQIFPDIDIPISEAMEVTAMVDEATFQRSYSWFGNGNAHEFSGGSILMLLNKQRDEIKDLRAEIARLKAISD